MYTLVGQRAPDFTTAAVLGGGEIVDEFNLQRTISGKYGLLFFYPLDFTFVCPSELIALQNKMDRFKELNIEVMGVSVDSQFTHNAWRNTSPNDGGIGDIDFTLLADVSHNICKTYCVEHPEAKVALRAAFMIDKQGIIRSQIVNDLPIGRNIDEIIRIFEAMQFHEQHGEVCPANWREGNSGMEPTKQGVAAYLTENADRL